MLLALVFVASSSFAAAQQGDHVPQETAEDEARRSLEKAQSEVAKGDYAGAQRLYRSIAKRYVGTTAATIAERRSKPSAFLGWADALRSGPSSNRADIVLMGDGYELADIDTFDEQMKSVVSNFLQERCLQEYASYFNFLRAELVSAESGIDGYGREYDTALDASITGAYGYPSADAARVAAMLSEMPEHDGIALAFVKAGQVGGTSGRDFATVGGMEEKIARHELGHAFADLSCESDQYDDRLVPAVHPINTSLTGDPARVPWKHWLEAGAPGANVVRGGGGKSQGVWRPSGSGCVMQGFDAEHTFCRVCNEAIMLRVYSLVDPIDACSPEVGGGGVVARDQPLEFEVRTMRPRTHSLSVRWWVFHKARGTIGEELVTRTDAGATSFGDRRDRGPLLPIPGEPRAESRGNRAGVHKLVLLPSELEEGVSLIVCRVRDDTLTSWDRWPMVLSDPHGLLESERSWYVLK